MAHTFVEWTGDGSRTLYPVQFDLGHIREDYVYVYQGGHTAYNTQLAYTWVSDTQIELTTPVEANTKFYIRRIVDRNTLLNDYQNGALLDEENLDDSYKQTLAIVEEITDGFWATGDVASAFNTDIDLQGHKIANLTMATTPDDNDAANVAYVKKLSGALAEYWAKIAEAHATAASSSAEDVRTLSTQWHEDYLGKFAILPDIANYPNGITDGALCNYNGPLHTQGLYSYRSHLQDEFTGQWKLVSGVGPQGATGAQGAQGPIGETGEQGIQGVEGIQGQQGIQGAIGDTGAAGPKGETGTQGVDGPQGVVGPVGSIGPEGVVGPEGARGQQGIQGALGLQGDVGPIGETGAQGVIGPQGVAGPTGGTGSQGPTGPRGDTGPQGIQGPTGIRGETGADGQNFSIDTTGTLAGRDAYDDRLKGYAYFATDYEVAADAAPNFDRHTGDGVTTKYVLTWTPDGQQSVLVEVGGVVQGPDMYTLSVVNDTYTLDLDTAPTTDTKVLIREVTINTGFGAIFIKASDVSADWGTAIPFGKGPRGDQGPTGVQGPTGAQGSIGNQGSIGPAGPRGAQGPEGAAGPQGAVGDTGPQGIQGHAGDRGPTGIQGASGDQGSTGSIGPTGPQGPTGLVGPQGAQGDVGPRGATGSAGDRGPVGIQGPAGDKGTTGSQGPQGNKGATGSQGAQGAKGAQGARGDQGSTGPTGATGADGNDGARGATGNTGPDGAAGRASEGAYIKTRTLPYYAPLSFDVKYGTRDTTHLCTVDVVKGTAYDRYVKLGGGWRTTFNQLVGQTGELDLGIELWMTRGSVTEKLVILWKGYNGVAAGDTAAAITTDVHFSLPANYVGELSFDICFFSNYSWDLRDKDIGTLTLDPGYPTKDTDHINSPISWHTMLEIISTGASIQQ